MYCQIRGNSNQRFRRRVYKHHNDFQNDGADRRRRCTPRTPAPANGRSQPTVVWCPPKYHRLRRGNAIDAKSVRSDHSQNYENNLKLVQIDLFPADEIKNFDYHCTVFTQKLKRTQQKYLKCVSQIQDLF